MNALRADRLAAWLFGVQVASVAPEKRPALECACGRLGASHLDTDLAERLEYEQPRDIRKLIERHRPTLEKLGRVEVRATVAQTQGGRPAMQNYLTEEQAAFIAAKSDMPKATAITIAMVKVFVAWGKGELPAQQVER